MVSGWLARGMLCSETKGTKETRVEHTLVPLQPSLKAASCANNSPKPSIMPLMNGRSRLMAAPRTRPQMVGGLYRTNGGDDEDSGEADISSAPE